MLVLLLAGALEQNSALDHLDLSFNDIGSKGAISMADLLYFNGSLKDIDLGNNPISDDGAIRFAEMLMIKTTTETVHISNFGKRGLKAFAASLPHMRGLKTVDFPCGVTGLTSDIGNSFVDAIEQNTSLEGIHFYGVNFHDANAAVRQIIPKVNHLLALNRGGRRILKSLSVPRSLWPRVLDRCSNDNDALFCFLREKSDVLFEKNGAQKRKREDSGV